MDYDPGLYAPARYRKACQYEAFVPDRLCGSMLTVSGPLAGVISVAKDAVRSLNALAEPALAPLARLLLRSIDSSTAISGPPTTRSEIQVTTALGGAICVSEAALGRVP